MSATAAPPPAAAPPELRVEVPRRPSRRDVSLDLVRGLAMVVLVVNHVHLDSALERATEPFLSAAEALVLVSGVVVGMVFGRRWITEGPRRVTRALLRRAFVLYRASVCVVAAVGLLTLVPFLETGALTIAPQTSGPDLYAFDGPLRTLLAIVTLEAGPWQFNVLGLFIALIAIAPVLLWALARGWWPAVLVASWGLFALGRATGIEVVPAPSEDRFPLLIWQVLFVHGVVAGWHRDRLRDALVRVRPAVVAGIVLVAAAAAYVRLHELGLAPLGRDGPAWRAWDARHFDKVTLDAARLVSMVAFTAAAYLLFRRFEPIMGRTAGRVLLPLGRSSFYVFIVHVFLCLAVASIPWTAGDGLGLIGNAVVQLAILALLVAMVRRRLLFRWIPR